MPSPPPPPRDKQYLLIEQPFAFIIPFFIYFILSTSVFPCLFPLSVFLCSICIFHEFSFPFPYPLPHDNGCKFYKRVETHAKNLREKNFFVVLGRIFFGKRKYILSSVQHLIYLSIWDTIFFIYR
jgi:hypothetical protein